MKIINRNEWKIAASIIVTFVIVIATPRHIFSQASPTHGFGFIPLRSQSPIQQLCFGIQHHPP